MNLNLANEKKALLKYSKFLVVLSYLLIFLGVFSLVKTAFFAFNNAGTERIEFKNKDSSVTIVEIDTNSMLFIYALKGLISLFIMRWGCQGLKVFKPIVKGNNGYSDNLQVARVSKSE